MSGAGAVREPSTGRSSGRTWRELWRACRHPLRLLRELFTRVQEDDIMTTAAALAYYFFFSIFPLLLFVLALWGASAAFSAPMNGLNRACRVREQRPWWRVRLYAIGLTVALSLFMLGFAASSAAFSYYVGEFASYDKTYGSLGAVIILLFWMYILAFFLLLGGELNALLAAPSGPPRSGPRTPAWKTEDASRDDGATRLARVQVDTAHARVSEGAGSGRECRLMVLAHPHPFTQPPPALRKSPHSRPLPTPSPTLAISSWSRTSAARGRRPRRSGAAPRASDRGSDRDGSA